MNQNRRKYLTNTFLILALAPIVSLEAAVSKVSSLISATIKLGNPHEGNFFYIYSNLLLKNKFYNFLRNVFHLYPEDQFHLLIEKTTLQEKNDQNIYVKIQENLSSIKPLLSELSYALPALKKQKQEMMKQTVSLLNRNRKYNGYLEIGSNGRYYDLLEENIDITGNIFFMSDVEPGYSPLDLVDRGQITNPAQFLSLNSYQPQFEQKISMQSVDLITVYIGFHHCPLELRDNFFRAISNCLRTGGKLILRDHDVRDEDLHKIVCLAHDVFNAGTGISWSNNQNELRHFYTLDFIVEQLNSVGLHFDNTKLYQDGDPTINTLMSFTKV